MTDTSASIDSFLADWAAAEQAADTSTLDRLLIDDFHGVGPLGFVLPKPAWLARFDGGLTYHSLHLDELQSRHHGDTAIITARQVASGTIRGNPLPFQTVRATLTLVGHRGHWGLAGIHMSFIAGTPGAPPIPGAAPPPAPSTS